MTRSSRIACLLCVSLTLSSCVTPGTIEEQPWIEVTSEHFTLLSNASEKQTVELARDLERFRAAILKLTGSRDVDSKVPVRIHVLDDLFPAFRPGSLAVGYIVPTAHDHYIAIDANRAPDETRRIVFHEFVHFVLRNQDDPTQYPLWYDEGLAEMLGTGRITQAGFEIALNDRRRLQPLIDGGLVHETNLSLERIMTTRSLYGWHPALIADFYNKAWAFTHFLHTAHLSEGVDYFQPMLRYLQLLDQGCEPAEALDRAFGSTYADLERRFHRYLTQRGIPAVRLAAEDLQASDRASTRIVPKGEALYRLGDLARHAGAKKSDLATDLFRQAQAADPAYALAYEGIAWSRAPQGDPEAQGLFARAIELARELPAAYAGLGATHLADPELDEDGLIEGLQSLEKARALLPWSSQTSVWLAGLYVRAGGDNQY
jgi:hypothetical protein